MTVSTRTDQRSQGTKSDDETTSSGRRISVLEVFASELVPVGPNMSTPPEKTDFDDQ
jgi:hypothetical protein